MNTERRGINRRLHGAFRALAEQARDANYGPEDAKGDLKWLATVEGYPIRKRKVRFKGKIVEWTEPVSLTGQSDHVAMVLMQTVQVFADEHNLYLYEYDENEIPFRSVGGRDKKRMLDYIEYLRSIGQEDEARELEKTPRWKYKEEEPKHGEYKEQDIF